MSSSVLWAITRKQNSFLRKQRHSGACAFSSDPYNLTNENKKSASGLVNDEAISITATSSDDGKTSIALRLKSRKRANKPSNSDRTAEHMNRGDSSRVGKRTITYTNAYRKDLQRAALARFSALNKASKVQTEELGARDRSRKKRKVEE